MSVVAGLRFNPTVRAFYQHLRQAGKAPKVALVACMRKLLVRLNAMVKAAQPWNAHLLSAAPLEVPRNVAIDTLPRTDYGAEQHETQQAFERSGFATRNLSPPLA